MRSKPDLGEGNSAMFNAVTLNGHAAARNGQGGLIGRSRQDGWSEDLM
jgi:hypothetical protein